MLYQDNTTYKVNQAVSNNCFDYTITDTTSFETPQEDLLHEPEYQQLVKLCKELHIRKVVRE